MAFIGRIIAETGQGRISIPAAPWLQNSTPRQAVINLIGFDLGEIFNFLSRFNS
jgi:hypothetical protein